jgi:hypothetical protein
MRCYCGNEILNVPPHLAGSAVFTCQTCACVPHPVFRLVDSTPFAEEKRKKCTACRLMKPVSEFAENQGRCNECRKAAAKVYRDSKREAKHDE